MSDRVTQYDVVRAAEKVSEDEPHGWIQWKGTDVCMDLWCKCGAQSHVDGDFFYTFKCSACGTVYGVGARVVLAELPPGVEPDHEPYSGHCDEDDP